MNTERVRIFTCHINVKNRLNSLLKKKKKKRVTIMVSRAFKSEILQIYLFLFCISRIYFTS